jgi:hypothetical protein
MCAMLPRVAAGVCCAMHWSEVLHARMVCLLHTEPIVHTDVVYEDTAIWPALTLLLTLRALC